MAGRKVWAADEILAAADLQSYIQDQVVFVYANAAARTSGILSPTEGMVSYLQDTNLLYFFDGSSWVEVAPNVGTAGTYTKVTTDAKGRVSSGTTLSASDIPALDSTKITTGTFGSDRITGTFGSDRITGNFNANRIDAGTFDIARIPAGTSATQVAYGNHTHAFNQITAGAINNGGYGITCGYITSPDTYNRAISGSYRALWINSSGDIGYTSSSKKFKQDIVNSEITISDVCSLRVVNFKYKNDVADLGDDAPIQLGLIAEEVASIPSLEQFVYFDDDKPVGINYEHLVLALIPAIQNLNNRVSELEKVVV